MHTLHPAAIGSWLIGKWLSGVVFERQQNNNDSIRYSLPNQLIWNWIYTTK
ncbi:hypothetical protein [Dysgonomonas macrotermitis]|uniref:hypothetical protein n=1 Tax=Dysgonomonas macrotermitis TaxID=1346286 RepID=UPI0012FCEE46|nr:hypothetical protein [Dysgonomonas macrotermitis]